MSPNPLLVGGSEDKTTMLLASLDSDTDANVAVLFLFPIYNLDNRCIHFLQNHCNILPTQAHNWHTLHNHSLSGLLTLTSI